MLLSDFIVSIAINLFHLLVNWMRNVYLVDDTALPLIGLRNLQNQSETFSLVTSTCYTKGI